MLKADHACIHCLCVYVRKVMVSRDTFSTPCKWNLIMSKLNLIFQWSMFSLGFLRGMQSRRHVVVKKIELGKNDICTSDRMDIVPAFCKAILYYFHTISSTWLKWFFVHSSDAGVKKWANPGLWLWAGHHTFPNKSDPATPGMYKIPFNTGTNRLFINWPHPAFQSQTKVQQLGFPILKMEESW